MCAIAIAERNCFNNEEGISGISAVSKMIYFL